MGSATPFEELISLDLTHNEITVVPESIASLESLKTLALRENPLDPFSHKSQVFEGLVGHWKFDEGCDTEVADSSGNVGTVTRILPYDGGVLRDYEEEWQDGCVQDGGQVGSAIRFREEGGGSLLDYVEITGANNVNTDLGGNNTVCFWINLEGLPSSIFSWGSNGMQFKYSNEKYYLDFYVVDGSSTYRLQTEIADITSQFIDKWVHVAAVFYNGLLDESGNWKLYIDGEEQVLSLLSTPIAQASAYTSFSFGRIAGGSSEFSIDDLQIYNRELNKSEIQTLAQSSSQQLYSFEALAGKPIDLDLQPNRPEEAETISELANSLYNNPVMIYEYVVNNIQYEPYSGMKKDALTTLQTGAGNSWDTAVLLSELYGSIETGEDEFIESTLVTGNVVLPYTTAAEYFGVYAPGNEKNIIDDLLTRAGLYVSSTAADVTFKQAWLTTDLGLPVGSPEYILTPAWKFQYQQPEIRNMLENVVFDTDPNTGNYFQPLPDDSIREDLPHEYLENIVREYLAEYEPGTSIANVIHAPSPILRQSFDSLPTSAPSGFGVSSEPTTGELILQNHRLRISLWDTNDSVEYFRSTQMSMADIAALPLAIRPTPDGDEYMPQLLLDWQTGGHMELANDDSFSATTDLHIKVEHFLPGSSTATSVQTYTRKASEYSVISLDAGQISSDLLRKTIEQLNEATIDLYDHVTPTSDLDKNIGRLLHYLGTKYFYNSMQGKEVVCGLTGGLMLDSGVSSGLVSSATTFYALDSQLQRNLTFPYLPENIVIDVPEMGSLPISIIDSTSYDASSTESLHVTRRKIVDYVGSAMEHAVVEEVTNVSSVSTIKSFQLARANDPAIDILTFDSTNVAQVASLNHTQSIKDAIVATINDGYTVSIPESPTPQGDWTGDAGLAKWKEDVNGHIISDYVIAGASGGIVAGAPGSINLTLYQPEDDQGCFSEGDEINTRTMSTHHVDVASGNVHVDVTDIRIPNLGFPLEITRHYRSSAVNHTGFGDTWYRFSSMVGMGQGWFFTYSDRIVEAPDSFATGSVAWITDRGEILIFEKSGSNFITPEILRGTLVYANGTDANGGFIWTDQEGNVTIFGSRTWHATVGVCHLIKKVDRFGNGVSVTYSTSPQNPQRIANIKSVVNGTATSERMLTFEHNWRDTEGWYESITDHTGRTWTYGYAGTIKNLVEVHTPTDDNTVQSTTKYDYYPRYADGQFAARNDLLKSVTDAAGETTYNYYVNRRAFKVTDPAGNTETYVYNHSTDTTTVISANGNAINYTHNDIGCITKQLNPDRTTIETEWTNNKKSSVKNENGNVETFQYHSTLGKLTVHNRFGEVTEYTYDASHYVNLLSFIEKGDIEDAGDDHITNYYYGEETSAADYRTLDRIVDSLGNETTFVYPATNNGLPCSKTLPKGNLTTGVSDDYVTKYRYNNAGQLTKRWTYLESGIWVAERFEYSSNGRGYLVKETDKYYCDANGTPLDAGQSGNETEYTNDLLGNVILTVSPDPDTAGSGLSRPTVASVYDKLGRVVISRNITVEESPLETRRLYDCLGQLVSITHADGTVITYRYDALGNMIAEVDELGQTKRYQYNDHLQRVSTIYHDNSTIQKEYDGCGNLITTTDALDNVTEYRYDELGRKIEETLPDPDGGIDRIHRFFRYDAFGNLVSIRESHPGAYDDANSSLSDGLIGRWLLDDESGTTAISAKEPDGATNVGPNGTLNNMDASSWVEGVHKGALEFAAQDTNSEYVSITGLNDVDTTAGEKNTLSFWMNWDGVTAATVTPVEWGDISLVFDESQKLFGFRTSTSDVLGIDYTDLKGRWVHVAAVFCNQTTDAEDYGLYINGELQSLTLYGTQVAQSVSSSLTLGNIITSSKFGGLLDDVQAYNHELTANEVASLACTTRYEYDSLGRMVKMIESPVKLANDKIYYPTTTYYYDAHGNLTKTVDFSWNSDAHGTVATMDGSLVAHWKFNEGEGSIAYGATYSLPEAELQNSNGKPVWVAGRDGEALEFSDQTNIGNVIATVNDMGVTGVPLCGELKVKLFW